MAGETKHCNVTQEYYNLWNNTVIKNITSDSGITSTDLGNTVPAYQNCTVTSNINRTESSCPKLVQTECVGGKFNTANGTQELVSVPTFNSTELCECTGDFPTNSGISQSILCTCINDLKRNATRGFGKSFSNDYIITKNCTAKSDNSSKLTMDCVTKPCISDLHLQVFNLSVPSIKACNDSTDSQRFYPNITDLTTAAPAPATTSAAGASRVTQGSSSPSTPTAPSKSSPQTTPKSPGASTPKAGGSSSAAPGTSPKGASTAAAGTPTPKTTPASNVTSGTTASSNATSPRTLNVTTDGNVTEEEGSGSVTELSQLINASSTVQELLTSAHLPESTIAQSAELLKHVGGSPGTYQFHSGASSLNPLGGASILPLLLFFYYIFMFAGITKKAQRKTQLPSEKEE